MEYLALFVNRHCVCVCAVYVPSLRGAERYYVRYYVFTCALYSYYSNVLIIFG